MSAHSASSPIAVVVVVVANTLLTPVTGPVRFTTAPALTSFWSKAARNRTSGWRRSGGPELGSESGGYPVGTANQVTPGRVVADGPRKAGVHPSAGDELV